MKQLPIIKIEEEPGKYFFYDRRLKEARNVENPHDRIRLNDFEIMYYDNLLKKN